LSSVTQTRHIVNWIIEAYDFILTKLNKLNKYLISKS